MSYSMVDLILARMQAVVYLDILITRTRMMYVDHVKQCYAKPVLLEPTSSGMAASTTFSVPAFFMHSYKNLYL